MSIASGIRYRIITRSNGERVKQTLMGGHVVESRPLSRIKQTRTRRHLKKSRRRIGMR